MGYHVSLYRHYCGTTKFHVPSTMPKDKLVILLAKGGYLHGFKRLTLGRRVKGEKFSLCTCD